MKILTPENERKCWNCYNLQWVRRDDPGWGYCKEKGQHFRYDADLSKTTCTKWR